MEQLTELGHMEIVGFVVGIVSAVLAIVSIVFSALFFWWSKKESDNLSRLTSKIEEKVSCLEKLFDKMYDSTYQLVRENNQAMQKHLFPGSFGDQAIINREMDVFLYVFEKKRVKTEDVCRDLNMTAEMINPILKKMSEKSQVKVSDEGFIVSCINIPNSSDSSSDEFGDEKKVGYKKE